MFASYKPVVTSMRWPSSRVTTARLVFCNSPGRPLKMRTLPLRIRVLTLLTLTSNSFSTASLICLGRGARDLEHDLVVLGRHGRLFGDHRRDQDVVMARIGRAHLKRASSASSAA